jgi:DNA replication protein DnaC
MEETTLQAMELQTKPMTSLASLAEKLLQIAASKQHEPSDPIYACEACRDSQWIVIAGKGATLCECEKRRRRENLLAQIPLEYRGLDLATVQPMVGKHAKQEALFAAVKADPSVSLFLSGRNGCGKSLLGWLLYRQAVESGRPVVFLPLTELMRQFREWELDSEKLPVVDATTLRNAKTRWLVVLDEAEKARATEFASEKLCDLLDAVYTHRHQLIVTSNFNAANLREHWSKQNPVYGASIMRRIVELDGLIQVEMF